MQIEHLKLSKLKPYEKNARVHSKKQVDLLAQNIERFGFTTPVLIDKDDSIIAGHGRLLAMKQLGKEEVPCVRMENLSEEEVKALRLADNQIAQMGEFDMKLVIDELKELTPEMFDLTGFDKDLIIEPDEKDDEIPENVPAKSKLGDLYELGQHRVLCGDSTQEEAVLRLMEGKKADMSFTSPPYNLGENGRLSFHDKSLKNKYHEGYVDDNPEYKELITDTTRMALDNAKDVFVNLQILAGNKKDILLWLAELSDNFKDIFFWKKQTCQPSMAENVANSQTELILLFGTENTSRSWGNQKFRGTFSNMIETKSASGENKNAKIHNATFPVELPMKFIVEAYKEGSIVLDLFCGTGSTLIASQKTGRICYGMELDEKYVDVCVERWCKYTGITKIKKNGVDYEWELAPEV